MLYQEIPFLTLRTFENLERSLIIHTSDLSTVLNCLKKHIGYQYTLLSCISGVDYSTIIYRFGISYEILSITYNTRLNIKIFFNNPDLIQSIVDIYKCANWWEREIWDMFGIFFYVNLDLRRILTDYGFEGHPLRKDFPVHGFLEIFYKLKEKKILSDFVSFSQESRFYVYDNSWHPWW